jgi:para-aminobenzoate synthetase component 1
VRGPRLDVLREGRWERVEGDPFAALEELLARCLDEAGPAPGFRGVAAGWLGYDLARHVERLPRSAVDDQGFPELFAAVYPEATVFDHRSGELRRLAASRLGRHARRPPPPLPAPRPTPLLPPRGFDRAGYVAAVRKAKERIRAGDIFQVNLSQRFAASTRRRPLELYEALRRASPAPFAALIELGELSVVSSSPEEFLAVDGDVVRTRPIKGTRPRGSGAAEDEALARELLLSEKDRAELTMIVDLMRNDLGRVAVPGSVHVPRPRTLERHPTVWHLSAEVRARLRAGVGLAQLLRATFPGGSVTGAPKVRAMEIIDELEPTRRGVFTGALFWAELGGAFRSSVAIRTMQRHGASVSFQAGGAVVWDSDPEEEYRETLVKAQAMADALGVRLDSSPACHGRGGV